MHSMTKRYAFHGERTVFVDYLLFVCINGMEDNLIAKSATEGLDFNANPTIFIGGGARMLRQFINKSNLVNNFEFVGNDKANAIAFAKLLKGIQ